MCVCVCVWVCVCVRVWVWVWVWVWVCVCVCGCVCSHACFCPTLPVSSLTPSEPQFNMTITFVPNVCDTRTYSEMIINITGPFSDLLNYVVFENRSSAVNGNKLYGLTVDTYMILKLLIINVSYCSDKWQLNRSD